MTKTVVLGFDALDFHYLNKFSECMPNFQELRQSGEEAKLEATLPPVTGSTWPSIFTGVDPSHHGVHSFFTYDGGYPEDARIANRNDIQMPTIWDYLSNVGLSSIVLNVPMTHPAEPFNGVLYPGYIAPEESKCYPEDLSDELEATLGEYRIYSNSELSGGKKDINEYLDLIEMRGEAAKYLIEEKQWDMAFLTIQKTDNVFHDFDDPQKFRKVYSKSDKFLGKVLNSVEENTDNANIVICSDHGIGHIDGYRIFLNEILAEQGYLSKSNKQNLPSIPSEKGNLGKEAGSDSFSTSELAFNYIEKVLTKAGLSPGSIYRIANSVNMGKAITELLPNDLINSVGNGVDWKNSQAYVRRPSEMGIRLNIEGREPNGLIPKQNAHDVRSQIINMLSNLKTPDGKYAFSFVEPYGNIYNGNMTDDACDILLLPTEMNSKISTNMIGEKFSRIDSYEHQRNGVLIMSGPDVADSIDDKYRLQDIAPGIMNMLDLPVPERMSNGPVPSLTLKEYNFKEYQNISFGLGGVDTNNSDVEKRLEDLGYL